MSKNSRFNQWNFLKVFALILVLTLVGSSQLAVGAEKLPKSIVIRCGGGTWFKTFKQVYADPWTKKTGVKIIHFSAQPAEALVKIRANINNPPIDICNLPEALLPDAIRWGILEKMSLETVPNLKYVKPVFHARFDNYVVTNNYIFCVVLYNKKKIKNPPKTWMEMVDRTIKGEFGKRVSFPSLSYGYAYPFFWVIGRELGDSVEKMDGAFEKFKLMKPFIPKFWTSAVEAINLIEAGEVDIIAYWEHRAWKFIDQGREDWDLVIPAPGIFEGATTGKIVNSHPIVFDLINFILDAENNSKWAANMSVHPVNSNSRTSPKMQERYDRTTPGGELIVAPAKEISDVRAKWMDRWNKEIGG